MAAATDDFGEVFTAPQGQSQQGEYGDQDLFAPPPGGAEGGGGDAPAGNSTAGTCYY